MIFDKQKWEQEITKPDWYLRLLPDYKAIVALTDKTDDQSRASIRDTIYDFFQEHLENRDIALGNRGNNWDAERKPIDTIVLHHTKQSPGMTWQRLNAMHLLRIYANYYAAPAGAERHIRGKPIHSNHFRDAEQVFYTYHWLVRMGGAVERLLNDNEIGWHAGNWDVNCRSVGICLDNDLEESFPTHAAISSIARLIRDHYSQVETHNIIGHRQVNQQTICPGNRFLEGWRPELITQLSG